MALATRRALVLLLAGALVLGLVPAGGVGAESPESTANPPTADAVTQEGDESDAGDGEPRPDPTEDALGWEGGYWHDDPIAVDQRDGLTDEEREAYVARAKARVEQIRGREFVEDVSVEVVSREAFVEERRRQGAMPQLDAADEALVRTWFNQRYEATFLVDGETDAMEAIEGDLDRSVLGFYDPTEERLVVIAEESGRPVIDNATLVHELTHALQDQHFGLVETRRGVRTSDENSAVLGLIEGEASYVEARYEERCAAGEWDCVATPAQATPDRGDINRGAYAITLQPYSDGPAFVATLVERGGWAAVERAYERRPASTEQTIDPAAYPGERPTELYPWELPAPLGFVSPRNGWAPVGTDTLGEAWIYAMFYQQGVAYDNEIIPVEEYQNPERGEYDRRNYTSDPSDGWGNDYLFVYANDGNEGFVWHTTWDTAADARAFQRAYRDVLRGHGAERLDERTWVIREGGYAGGFAVVRRGNVVTVVKGPTVSDVSDIYPGIRGQAGQQSSPGGAANATAPTVAD